MAERPENPVGALESHLAEEAGYSDDSTAKLIARKTPKREWTMNINFLGLLEGLPYNRIERK